MLKWYFYKKKSDRKLPEASSVIHIKQYILSPGRMQFVTRRSTKGDGLWIGVK